MNKLNKNISGLIVGALSIILLCAAIYAQSLNFDFLNLDDNLSVTLNPVMYQGLNLDGIKWAFTTFSNPYYMPITRISFLIDSSIYGTGPWGYHLTNLILHILNALLVLYFLWLLSNKLLFSVITATLFAVHPQHIEAFIWISERKEVLSTFFGLLSLICYVTHVKKKQPDNIRTISNIYFYLLAILFFLFSLLAKPVWITLPFVLLLLDWWPLKRNRYDSIRLILMDKIPFILLVVLFISITLYSAASTVDEISNSAQTLPLIQRILNSTVVYITYLFLTIYPADLPVYFPYPRAILPLWKTIGSIFILLTITSLFIFQRKKNPHLLTGWLWFLGTLIPMVGIISAGESVFIANRWTYIAHIGLFAAIVWTGVIYYERFPKSRIYLKLLVFFIIGTLSFSSWNQTRHWENSETFWKQAIRTTDNNHYAHYMLGSHYLDMGKTDNAISEFEQAYYLEPTDPFYVLLLGNAYGANGDINKAWEYYEKILTIKPGNIKLLAEMGLASLDKNRLRVALEFFQAAIDTPVMSPHHQRYTYLALLYAGHTLSMLGSPNEAMTYLERFIDSDPDNKPGLCVYAQNELRRISKRSDPSRSVELLANICANN